MPKVGMEPIRRRQIIDAALRQIAEKGMDGVRLEDIARDCGVSKGIVSYYFGSKRSVVLEACRDFLSYFLESPGESEGAMKIMDCVLDLLFLPPAPGSEHFGIPSASRRNLMLQIYAVADRDDEIAALVREFYAGYEQGIGAIVEYGVSEGEFRAMDQQEMQDITRVIMSFLDGLIIRKLISPPSQDASRECRAFAGRIIGEWLGAAGR